MPQTIVWPHCLEQHEALLHDPPLPSVAPGTTNPIIHAGAALGPSSRAGALIWSRVRDGGTAIQHTHSVAGTCRGCHVIDRRDKDVTGVLTNEGGIPGERERRESLQNHQARLSSRVLGTG